MPAVLGGGVITFLIAIGWSRLFPALAEVDHFDQIRPPEPEPVAAPVAVSV